MKNKIHPAYHPVLFVDVSDRVDAQEIVVSVCSRSTRTVNRKRDQNESVHCGILSTVTNVRMLTGAANAASATIEQTGVWHRSAHVLLPQWHLPLKMLQRPCRYNIIHFRLSQAGSLQRPWAAGRAEATFGGESRTGRTPETVVLRRVSRATTCWDYESLIGGLAPSTLTCVSPTRVFA